MRDARAERPGATAEMDEALTQPNEEPNPARRRHRQRRERPNAPVVLVAMPWQALRRPSIQLGILKPVLERAGIRTHVRSLWLTFVEYCIAETAHRADGERLGAADYVRVSDNHYAVGLGEWIFAVPPFRDASATVDAEYLAYLRRHGVSETDIAKALAMRALVPAFLESCADEILALGARVVGFTSTFSQNVPSLALAQRLKLRDPSVRIVFGGANCDGPMGAALHRAFPWVDVVVRGEAERVLSDVVRDLLARRTPRAVPGLCYRDADRSVAVDPAGAAAVTMDDVPAPVFDEYFERLDKTSFGSLVGSEIMLPYESARGCWWGAKSHCTFCGLNGSAMAFRSKSPDRVVNEVRSLARQYRRLDFQVVDNIMDLRYLREVLPRLRDAGHDVRLFYEVKANMTREHVRLLREAGVLAIQPGIESLSTPILRLMRKGVTAFQNVRLLRWCAEYGVRCYWNLISGFPGEPPEEYARMAAEMPALHHLDAPNAGTLMVERFSPYHERPAQHGLDVLGPLDWYGLVYPVDAATLADLAYAFEHRYADGREPKTYAQPVRAAIAAWNRDRSTGYRSLRYRRGPGFLTIRDRRPGLEAADYTFGEDEAAVYLACQDGATPADAARTVRAAGVDVSADVVREYLDGLVTMRLVYREGDRYLALALPSSLPEESYREETSDAEEAEHEA